MPRNADNERHWQAIAERYAPEPGPINLENGYFGRMSRVVQTHYLEQVAFINRSNSLYVRQTFEQGENVEIRRQLAELMDVDPESVAFTRNATEALQSLIRNYNRLQPGDQVLISDLEYDTVKGAMRWLAGYRGVEVILDGAHALGQIEFNLAALGIQFAGDAGVVDVGGGHQCLGQSYH